jgi:hypothetical protein
MTTSFEITTSEKPKTNEQILLYQEIVRVKDVLFNGHEFVRYTYRIVIDITSKVDYYQPKITK